MRWLVLLLPLLLTVASGDEPGVSSDGDWLMMVISLSRHGDRAPQTDKFITEAADQAFFRGRGELTTEGATHAREVGQAYRQAYVTRGKFIDGKLSTKEVRFQASDVHRTQMTAGSFASGLFVDNDENLIPPIYSVPYQDDHLLAINFNCENGWQDVQEKYGLTETSDMADRLLSAMRSKEWNCSQPPSEQSDTVIAENANSITKPELNNLQVDCAENSALTFMYSYIEQLSGSGTDDPRARVRLQRTVGTLASQIIGGFRNMTRCYEYNTSPCDPYHEMYLSYVAHDVNLLGIMNSFSLQQGAADIFQRKTPAYAASLSMELWVKNNQYYVRMWLKNGSDAPFAEFDFCRFIPNDNGYTRVGRFCTLDSLEKAKNLYLDDSEGVCEMTNP